MNFCQHSCAVESCGAVFEHTGECDEGYFGRLCTVCEAEGFFLRECAECHDMKPMKRGWICGDCGKKGKVAA